MSENCMTARELDDNDPLHELREHFVIPEGVHYLNGNSLGLMPKAVGARMESVVNQEWSQGVVGSWNSAGWFELPQRVAGRMQTLLGAQHGETVIADSTSINLYKLLSVALARHPHRPELLIEDGLFPTDGYVAQGLVAAATGLNLRRVTRQALEGAISNRTAAVLVTHVHYRDGHCLDLPRLQARALEFDVPVVWDLAHSVGAMPLELHQWGVEFAVGCTYKFLNGGPGAPGFAYVARHLHARLHTPIQGWFGHARPFDFSAEFSPANDASQLQVGTPPILSLSALDTALTIWDRVDINLLRDKSIALFDRFIDQLACHELIDTLPCITPRLPTQRGSQISFSHPQAYGLCRALAARGVIGDYRAPGILRFGLTPMYLRYADIDASVAILADILQRPEHLDATPAAAGAVT